MTDEEKVTDEAAAVEKENTAAEEETAEEEKEEAGGEENEKESKKMKASKEIKLLQTANKALEEKNAELDDRYKRLAAEYDNFRKRSQKEKESSYSDAYADALKEILPVIDNLERAIAFANENPEDKLSQGVILTLKQFEEAITKMGIEPVGKAGDKFDPNLHNAVMHDEDPEKGENEITDVFMKGYKKGDRVIRYAMVKTVN